MRIAAIDVGSNSVHMIVCRIRPDLSFEVIDREKDMIRLGAGSLATHALGAERIALAMQTLTKFKRLAESHGVDEIIAAATSAVREADNGGDFIAAARREVGLRLRVISGTEEARLIHLAAAYAVGIGHRRAVVVDIGGGSTEITLGTSARVEMGRSFKLGAIRLTERFARHDPMTRADERRLVRHIRRETCRYLAQIRRRGFERVIGTSGTIQALGSLASGARRGPNDVRRRTVSAAAIGRLRHKLAGMPLSDRLAVPGLDPRRADVAGVGGVLLDSLLDRSRRERHHAQRLRAPRRPRARLHRAQSPNTSERPNGTPTCAGAASSSWPSAVTIAWRTPSRWRALRSRCSTRPAAGTRSAGPSASGWNTPRSSTTSASTSVTRDTTSTRTTSFGTATCAGSTPRKSKSWRSWHATIARAPPSGPTTATRSFRARGGAPSSFWARWSVSPRASSGATCRS